MPKPDGSLAAAFTLADCGHASDTVLAQGGSLSPGKDYLIPVKAHPFVWAFASSLTVNSGQHVVRALAAGVGERAACPARRLPYYIILYRDYMILSGSVYIYIVFIDVHSGSGGGRGRIKPDMENDRGLGEKWKRSGMGTGGNKRTNGKR